MQGKLQSQIASTGTETVLVTGGSGYVAGWMLVQLLAQGFYVRTTVRDLSRESAVRSAVATQTDPSDRLSFFAADLLQDGGWDDAVAGCDFIIHVASPMGQGQPRADLLTPAREGTLRILKAAARNSVKRVVLTSSTVAAATSDGSVADEATWTNPEQKNLNAYNRSKTLAERAAWQFVESTADAPELTTILPGMILGPVLAPPVSGSVELILRMLDGRVPALPRIGFSIVDVRDLADLHIRAMLAPEAAGQRFLGVGDFMWMEEIAKLLREYFGSRAAKVPTRQLPDFVLRIAALFQHEARFMAPMLGRRSQFNIAKAANLLDWQPRPSAQAVIECAEDLLRQKLA